MAKEPAGLRRWRLAHRKHKRVRHKKVYSVARRRRYGRKRKGGKKSKAFPLLLMAPVIPGFISAYNHRSEGAVQIIRGGVYEISGVDVTGQLPIGYDKLYKTAGLTIVGLVGHKLANKAGINRWVKKATLGYISL